MWYALETHGIFGLHHVNAPEQLQQKDGLDYIIYSLMDCLISNIQLELKSNPSVEDTPIECGNSSRGSYC